MSPGSARGAALLLGAVSLCQAAACRERPPEAHARALSSTSAAAPSGAPEASASASASAPPPSFSASSQPPRRRRARAGDARPVDPEALASAPPSPDGRPSAGFRGPVSPLRDASWIRTLAASPIVAIRYNGGGTSLSFRVRFADGARAVFKPEQTLSSSNYRAEIAAYHVDRLIGFGRTAVVVGRSVPRASLEAAVADDDALARRLEAEVPDVDAVPGAMIAWHDGPLVDATPPKGWKTALLGADEGTSGAERARLAAWVDLLVFDALIDNTDRWSGGNVLALGKDGPLVFLDNASAFLGSRARVTALPPMLADVCRFPAATIDAVRGAGALSERLAASLSRDPSGVSLEGAVRSALDRRREQIASHIDACEKREGAAATRLPPPPP